MVREDKTAGVDPVDTIDLNVLSSVAHDMRSPLGTVRQALEIMLEGIDGPLNEKQKERLAVALRNVARIESLTSEIKERALRYKEEQ